MKTIFVKFDNKDINYCFNTNDDVKIGDKISSEKYGNRVMIVTNVCNKSYKYYNSITGDLSDELNSTKQGEIKTLKILNNDDIEIVYCKKVNHD